MSRFSLARSIPAEPTGINGESRRIEELRRGPKAMDRAGLERLGTSLPVDLKTLGFP